MDVTNVLQVITSNLDPTKPLAIRLSACRALAPILKHSTPAHLADLTQMQIYNNLVLDLIPCGNEDTLHIILESLSLVVGLNSQAGVVGCEKGFLQVLNALQEYCHDSLIEEDGLQLVKIWCRDQGCREVVKKQLLPAYVIQLSTVQEILNREVALQDQGGLQNEAEKVMSTAVHSLNVLTIVVKNETIQEGDEILTAIQGTLNLLMTYPTSHLHLLQPSVWCLRPYIISAQTPLQSESTQITQIKNLLVSQILPSTDTLSQHTGYLCLHLLIHFPDPDFSQNLLTTIPEHISQSTVPSILQPYMCIMAWFQMQHGQVFLDNLGGSLMGKVVEKWIQFAHLFEGETEKMFIAQGFVAVLACKTWILANLEDQVKCKMLKTILVVLQPTDIEAENEFGESEGKLWSGDQAEETDVSYLKTYITADIGDTFRLAVQNDQQYFTTLASGLNQELQQVFSQYC